MRPVWLSIEIRQSTKLILPVEVQRANLLEALLKSELRVVHHHFENDTGKLSILSCLKQLLSIQYPFF